MDEDAFFSILEMNGVNLCLADKQKIIKSSRAQSITGPGPSSGLVQISYKDAIAMVNVDYENSGTEVEGMQWMIRQNQYLDNTNVVSQLRDSVLGDY